MSSYNAIKIILLGESGVGKTNLINVALDKKFEQNSIPSANSSFLEGVLKYNEKRYSYTLWDTAGQELYRSLNKIFMKGAKIVIFVYSIDNEQSFNQIEYWINSANETLGEEKYISAILANKSDLFEIQKISDDKGKELAKKHNMKFKLTSALDDVQGFKNFLKELILDYIDLIGPEEEKNFNIQIKKAPVKSKKKSFC